MSGRDAHDFYPTPVPLIEAALTQFRTFTSGFTPDRVLDPGAGTGVWGVAARKHWRDAWIAGVELREQPRPDAYDHWLTGDFLASATQLPSVDLVIGNPPYRHAEKFVRAAWDVASPNGYMLLLLRLAFLEGQARARGLWRELQPLAVWVCAARPSFIAEGEKAGRTDSTAYAVFVWQKGLPGIYAPTLGWLNWKTA